MSVPNQSENDEAVLTRVKISIMLCIHGELG